MNWMCLSTTHMLFCFQWCANLSYYTELFAKGLFYNFQLGVKQIHVPRQQTHKLMFSLFVPCVPYFLPWQRRQKERCSKSRGNWGTSYALCPMNNLGISECHVAIATRQRRRGRGVCLKTAETDRGGHRKQAAPQNSGPPFFHVHQILSHLWRGKEGRRQGKRVTRIQVISWTWEG